MLNKTIKSQGMVLPVKSKLLSL